MWVHSVRLDGVELDLDAILAELTIRHGRAAIYDEPSSSTCTLILRDPPRTFTRAFEVGASLEVDVIGNPANPPGPTNRITPRFRGRVSDAELSDPDLRIMAAGPIATLRRSGSVSTAGWPLETWDLRVARFLEAAGVTLYRVGVDAAFNPVLEPPPEAELSIANYLQELALTVGAAVFEDVDGRIAVDAIGARKLPSRIIRPVPPLLTLYSPVWLQALDVTNSVTVLYGPERALSETVSDPDSADRYGASRVELATTIALEADARRRAELRLAYGSVPTWQMRPAILLAAGADYVIGHRVGLSSLPPTAPFASWSPVLEGWTDRVDGDSFRQELAVSDPVASGFFARWRDGGADWRWLDMDAAAAWEDVISTDTIGG